MAVERDQGAIASAGKAEGGNAGLGGETPTPGPQQPGAEPASLEGSLLLSVAFPSPWTGVPEAVLAGMRFQCQTFEAATRHGIEAQLEAISVLQARSRNGLRLAADLAASNALAETLSLVDCFEQNAMLDFLEDAAWAVSIGAKLAAELADRLHREARRMAEDLALRTLA